MAAFQVSTDGEASVVGVDLIFNSGIGVTPDGTLFDAAGDIVARKRELSARDRKALARAMVEAWTRFGRP
ncbi:MAG: hypothetical protein ACT4P4_24305 [Betaproteobacteria bacterium]